MLLCPPENSVARTTGLAQASCTRRFARPEGRPGRRTTVHPVAALPRDILERSWQLLTLNVTILELNSVFYWHRSAGRSQVADNRVKEKNRLRYRLGSRRSRAFNTPETTSALVPLDYYNRTRIGLTQKLPPLRIMVSIENHTVQGYSQNSVVMILTIWLQRPMHTVSRWRQRQH